MKITNYIGQTPVVEAINEALKGFDNARKAKQEYVWRPFNFGGWTGTGKSNLARALSNVLRDAGFNYIEVPPNAGLRDLYTVFNKIASVDTKTRQASAIPFVIFWDEYQSQKKETNDIFKTLTTEVTVANTITRQGQVFHYDPTKHINILASNCAIDKALMRRCRNFQLTTYTKAEMARLIELMICKKHNITLDDAGVQVIVSRCKPLAGDIEEVSSAIVSRAKADGVKKMPSKLVEEVLVKQGFFPRGLRRSEMVILNQLVSGPATAAVLKFRVQDDKKKDTQERIDWLCSNNLTLPVRGGFALSKEGQEYVKMIAEKQKAMRAAKK